MPGGNDWNKHEAVVLDSPSMITVLTTLIKRHRGCSRLVICSTKHEFLDLLRNALRHSILSTHSHGAADFPIDLESGDQDHISISEEELNDFVAGHELLQPTIHMLTATAGLKVAYCPSVPHTLAYLSSLSINQEQGVAAKGVEILFVLNPIAQHAGTRSESAQGLTKLFVTAITAAHTLGAKLVVAECRAIATNASLGIDGVDTEDERMEEGQPASVWDDRVPITTAKAKGAAAREAGWQGRSTSLRTIAGKWCRFISID